MSPSVKHFLRHYGEMVLAMFLGMAVLGSPRRLGACAPSARDSDAFMFLGMATTMTVPMVGWMRYRGHGWRANTEMSASMFVPTFAVIGLLSRACSTDIGVLMAAEHVVMLLAMVGAMLLRPDEYIHHHARAGDGMSVAARLAGFAVVLALVFAGAAFAGSRLDVHPGKTASQAAAWARWPRWRRSRCAAWRSARTA